MHGVGRRCGEMINIDGLDIYEPSCVRHLTLSDGSIAPWTSTSFNGILSWLLGTGRNIRKMPGKVAWCDIN